ncbi:hypothetical protein QCA50_019965 [Cerrena zonata]|uniref:Uncharacterized protein n=1 Tax=Cerrena zonata TaxID=2478898 RepID=A0AAW0FIP1_9APHY
MSGGKHCLQSLIVIERCAATEMTSILKVYRAYHHDRSFEVLVENLWYIIRVSHKIVNTIESHLQALKHIPRDTDPLSSIDQNSLSSSRPAEHDGLIENGDVTSLRLGSAMTSKLRPTIACLVRVNRDVIPAAATGSRPYKDP